MRLRLLALAALVLPCLISGCDPERGSAAAEAPPSPAATVRTQPGSPTDSEPSLTIVLAPDSARYYPWIEVVQSAPVEWLPVAPEDAERGDVVHGARWRFIVTRSEIHVAVHLERVSVGLEGCCMELALVRSVDVDTIARHFGLRGELSEIDDLVAVSTGTFRFVLNGLPLRMDILSPDSARIVRAAPR